MLIVLVGETGPLRPIFSVTLSPRLTLVLVVKPPSSWLYSSTAHEDVPVWHWFSLTTGTGLGQTTSAFARAEPSTISAMRAPSARARMLSNDLTRRPRIQDDREIGTLVVSQR